MTHDGYLKSFQVTKPSLQQVTCRHNYTHDVLMIDEGQDMNPAMLDIFMNQNTIKVIVGDPNQQIYTFRGAVNALDSVEATHTYTLTQSFRFGPEIGFAANCCLDPLQKLDSQTLVGGKNLDFIINGTESEDLEVMLCKISVCVNLMLFAFSFAEVQTHRHRWTHEFWPFLRGHQAGLQPGQSPVGVFCGRDRRMET